MTISIGQSRGLGDRGVEQPVVNEATTAPPRLESTVALTPEISARAERAAREHAKKGTKPGWSLWSLVLSYHIPDQATSYEDVYVVATSTYKRIKEEPLPAINYSSTRQTFVLSNLLYGDSSTGRRPIMSKQALDKRTRELDRKEKDRLLGMEQNAMLEGEPDFQEEMKAVIEERIRHAKDRIAHLGDESSEEDYRDALSEVIKVQELSADPETIDLVRQVEEKHRRKIKRAEKRLRQKSPIRQPPEVGGAQYDSAELPVDRDAVLASVRKLVEANKPRGHTIQSVDIGFSHLQSVGWVVAVTVVYVVMNRRGLPSSMPTYFDISLQDLLADEGIKHPAVRKR